MDAHEVLTTTRAVRRRLDIDQQVSRKILEHCIDTALQAPAGGNRRSYQFIVLDDPKRIAALGVIYQRAFEQYRNSPQVATNAFPDRPDLATVQQRVFSSAQHLAEIFPKVPALVIPCVLRRPESLRTNHAQASFWGSVIPAVWSFMLAARNEGLGTVYTTMHLRFEEEAATLLGIPFEDVAQVAAIPVAYTIGKDFRPAGHDPRESYMSWNGWKQ